MKAKKLKAGDTFRVIGHTDPEAPYRVCRTNNYVAGLRFGFPNNHTYWCYMGEDVEVELVYTYTTMMRHKLEALVWKHKHRDYKTKTNGGEKLVLILREGKGTCLEPLSEMSEEDLLGLLPVDVRATVPMKIGS
jgi:hypothetical protein